MLSGDFPQVGAVKLCFYQTGLCESPKVLALLTRVADGLNLSGSVFIADLPKLFCLTPVISI